MRFIFNFHPDEPFLSVDRPTRLRVHMLADPPSPTRRPTLKKQPTPIMLHKKVRLPGDVITAPDISVQSTGSQVKDDIGEGLTGNMKRKAYVLSAWDKMPAAPTSMAQSGDQKLVDAKLIVDLLTAHNGKQLEEYLQWAKETAAEREDGTIKMDMWVLGVFKVERETRDEQLRVIAAEWREILTRQRRTALLTSTFMKMDADCSGAVDLGEFQHLVEGTEDSAVLPSIFALLDQQGNSDGKVDLNEWVQGMLNFGADLSDAEFEAETAKWHRLLTKNQRSLWYRLFKRGHAHEFVMTMRGSGATHLMLVSQANDKDCKRVKLTDNPAAAAAAEERLRAEIAAAAAVAAAAAAADPSLAAAMNVGPALSATGEAQCVGAKNAFFDKLPVRKTCYLSSPSLAARQTIIHMAVLEDLTDPNLVCGAANHPEIIPVEKLRAAGVEPICDGLVFKKDGRGPLREYLNMEGGEDAFGRYAERVCGALMETVRSEQKAKGGSETRAETRPLSARVRPQSAARSVARMATHGARSLMSVTQMASFNSRVRGPPRVLPPPLSPRAASGLVEANGAVAYPQGPFPPVSPRGMAAPRLLLTPRGGQYVAIFGERVYVNAIAHALGCAAGAPPEVLEAMLNIDLAEAEAILVPLYGGVHGSAIQHLRRPP